MLEKWVLKLECVYIGSYKEYQQASRVRSCQSIAIPKAALALLLTALATEVKDVTVKQITTKKINA